MTVAPALIMGMVGTLMLFLVDAGYRGPFGAQVRWTLCWFVLASVLVSRIAIQQGSGYASLYGLILGAATAFRLVQFLGLHPGALLLIALLWWCASKLTRDCTVIDDDEDASGEGLLHRARLQPDESDSPDMPPADIPPATRAISKPKPDTQPPHAPGLWVLYFSLGALPVFGLGQLAIPADDAALRLRGFVFLCVYLACALGLLFLTSFLGLRRYLRQRRLVMPTAAVRLWMTFGTAATFGVLFAALFLPRPEAADTLAGLVGRPGPAPPTDISQRDPPGDYNGDAAQAPDRITERPSEHTAPLEPDELEHIHETTPTDRPDPGKAPQPSEVGNNQMTGDRQDRQDRHPPMPREMPTPPADPTVWLRWLTLIVGIVLGIVVLVRFGRQWLAALARARFRHGKPSPRPVTKRSRPKRPFAAYPNPFVTNQAARMTPAQLTTYTFDALQAWANDRGYGRRPDQTPGEFGQALAGHAPELSDELLGTVRLYHRVAYATDPPASDSIDVLQRLWAGLQRS